MNGLGHCVGASIFPKAQFDEKVLFTEITSVISQMENWIVFVNDLLSFYKGTLITLSHLQCRLGIDADPIIVGGVEA